MGRAGQKGLTGRGKGGAPIYFDEGRRAVFLQALREGAHMGFAAAEAGVSVSTVYLHRNKDLGFRAALQAAQDDAAERKKQEMLDRAIEAAEAATDPAERGRAENRLAARLRAVAPARARGSGAEAGAASLPRAEVDRMLLERLAVVNRRLGRG